MEQTLDMRNTKNAKNTRRSQNTWIWSPGLLRAPVLCPRLVRLGEHEPEPNAAEGGGRSAASRPSVLPLLLIKTV
jgi:hypothetical protein